MASHPSTPLSTLSAPVRAISLTSQLCEILTNLEETRFHFSESMGYALSYQQSKEIKRAGEALRALTPSIYGRNIDSQQTIWPDWRSQFLADSTSEIGKVNTEEEALFLITDACTQAWSTRLDLETEGWILLPDRVVRAMIFGARYLARTATQRELALIEARSAVASRMTTTRLRRTPPRSSPSASALPAAATVPDPDADPVERTKAVIEEERCVIREARSDILSLGTPTSDAERNERNRKLADLQANLSKLSKEWRRTAF